MRAKSVGVPNCGQRSANAVAPPSHPTSRTGLAATDQRAATAIPLEAQRSRVACCAAGDSREVVHRDPLLTIRSSAISLPIRPSAASAHCTSAALSRFVTVRSLVPPPPTTHPSPRATLAHQRTAGDDRAWCRTPAACRCAGRCAGHITTVHAASAVRRGGSVERGQSDDTGGRPAGAAAEHSHSSDQQIADAAAERTGRSLHCTTAARLLRRQHFQRRLLVLTRPLQCVLSPLDQPTTAATTDTTARAATWTPHTPRASRLQRWRNSCDCRMQRQPRRSSRCSTRVSRRNQGNSQLQPVGMRTHDGLRC